MKNKFSKGRLSYFFTPRIHGNVLAWVKPDPEWKRSKRVPENILRWEDDGGKMVDPVKQTAGANPDAARERANE